MKLQTSVETLPTNKLLFLDIEGLSTAIRYNKQLPIYFIGCIEVNETTRTVHKFTSIQKAVEFVDEKLAKEFTIVCHNAKFDYSCLKTHGLKHVIKPNKLSVACTMVMEYTRASNLESYSLDALTGQKTDVVQICVDAGLIKPQTNKIFWLTDWSNNQPVLDIISLYCINDIRATENLYNRLVAWYNQETNCKFIKRLVCLEFPMLEVLVELEKNGLHVNRQNLSSLAFDVQKDLDELKLLLSAEVGLMPELKWNGESYEPTSKIYKGGQHKNKNNVAFYLSEGIVCGSATNVVYNHCVLVAYNSSAATGHNWWLLSKTNPELIKAANTTKTGKPSLNKDYWGDISEQLPTHLPIAKILKATKALSMSATLANAIQLDGRVHCDFAHTRTRTGRLATSNPNLQNIPRSDSDPASVSSRFRQLFTATDNSKCILVADLDRIEIVVLAWFLSVAMKDNSLLEVCNSGADVHQANADKWCVSRTVAKTLIFLLVYGGGAGLILKRGMAKTLAEAESMVEAVEKGQPSINELKQKVWAKITKVGFISNPFNLRVPYPEVQSKRKWERLRGERQSFNCLIQATARDVLHLLLLETLPVTLKYGAKLVNVIHDEVMIECEKEIAEELMLELNKVWQDRTDILEGIRVNGDWNKGDNWYEAK